MPSSKKIELNQQYSKILDETPNFVMTRYQGLDVSTLTELRKKLREKGFRYKIIKNNVFKHVLQERVNIADFPYKEVFKGPIAIAFAGDDVPSVAKVLKDFGNEHEKMEIISGVMQESYFDSEGVKSLADLPSREESLAIIALSLNAPASKIAGGISNIMSSMARAIKAIGEKNG